MKIATLTIVLVILLSITSTIQFEPTIAASTIIVPDNYRTIREAVNASKSGDTIYVRAGIYYEHIALTKENISLVGENSQTTIIDGNGSGCCISVTRRNVTVSGFTLQNSRIGVELGPRGSWSRDHIKMYNVVVTQNTIAMEANIESSEISNCTFMNSKGLCIEILGSNNIINGNIIRNNTRNMELRRDVNSTVSNNIILSNAGIILSGCSETKLINNTVSGNEKGILLSYSTKIVMRNNTMINNTYNFDIYTSGLDHDVDTSNLVNGKPIYYWNNETNKEVPPDAGCVIVVDGVNITCRNLNLERNGWGILLSNCNNSMIRDVNSHHNINGICLIGFNNTITQNNASHNEIGIYISSSVNNRIEYNTLSENTYCGLYSAGSNSNTIISNKAINNTRGVKLVHSKDNTLSSNEMTDNFRSFIVNLESIEDYINNIDSSNTVNGKPMYYWINRHEEQVPTDAGYVALINSTGILVKDLAITNNDQGVLLAHAVNCTIENSQISNCSYGVFVYKSNNNIVSKNTLTNNQCGVGVDDDSNNNIVDNNLILIDERVSREYFYEPSSIYVSGITGIVLKGTSNEANYNILIGHEPGIIIDRYNNTVNGNILTNNEIGIVIPSTYGLEETLMNSTVSGNIITNSKNCGIFLGTASGIPEITGPSGNNITGNIVTNSECGIELSWHATKNIVSGNIMTNNTRGLILSGSKNILRNNVMDHNQNNFEIQTWVGYRNHDVDTSNTVNGRPIYIIVNQSNIVIDPSTFPRIGYLGVVDSTNVTIRFLSIANNGNGLFLARTSNSTIENNNFTSNTVGVSTYESSNNTLHDNNIENNAIGIQTVYSNNNTIYHNNFRNNTEQVDTDSSATNDWDGNYWSDYTGIDSDGDGIGDTPYIIDERPVPHKTQQDNYPIIPEFSAMMIMPLFVIATLATIILRKRRQFH